MVSSFIGIEEEPSPGGGPPSSPLPSMVGASSLTSEVSADVSFCPSSLIV